MCSFAMKVIRLEHVFCREHRPNWSARRDKLYSDQWEPYGLHIRFAAVYNIALQGSGISSTGLASTFCVAAKPSPDRQTMHDGCLPRVKRFGIFPGQFYQHFQNADMRRRR